VLAADGQRIGSCLGDQQDMIRISTTAAAFQAIAATLPFGSVGFERESDAKGPRQIWLERAILDRLRALRGPGESYSDVILPIAERDDTA
jgi:hypothetical protein